MHGGSTRRGRGAPGQPGQTSSASGPGSPGGSGCSIIVTPAATRSGMTARAAFAVQPPLASTHTSVPGGMAEVTAATMARSAAVPSSLPSLTLTASGAHVSQIVRACAATASGRSRPTVIEVRGRRSGSSPRSCHNGWPRVWASQSRAAISRAARAAGLGHPDTTSPIWSTAAGMARSTAVAAPLDRRPRCCPPCPR